MVLLAFKRVDIFMASEFGTFVIKIWIPFSILISVCFINKVFGIKHYWSVLMLITTEALIALVFLLAANRVALPSPVIDFLRTMYMDKCRNIIQFDKECARYDSLLFYTLKTGENDFSSIEFNTTLRVNTRGFRDDEPTMGNPDIVLIGDSYTMGWGVEQNETFAERLKKKIDKTTLNLGISSYGTAREVMAAKLFDLCNVDLIILQYGVLDELENREFVLNDFNLPISSKNELVRHQRWNSIWKSYFPLKYSYVAFFNLISIIVGKSSLVSEENAVPLKLTRQNLEDFFKIISILQEDFEGEILLVNFCQYGRQNIIPEQFMDWIRSNKTNRVNVLDLGKELNPEDFFVIDDHLNAKGHNKVASIIYDFILEKKLLH
jgi:hypothetical protein